MNLTEAEPRGVPAECEEGEGWPEDSDLLVKEELVQGTAQGHDPKPLASCHPAGPGAHHVKPGCSQKPLQFLKRAALSCPLPMAICVLTEILDSPVGAPAGVATGCGE